MSVNSSSVKDNTVQRAQASAVAAARASWNRRGWVTRRHIDLQRVHSSLCSG